MISNITWIFYTNITWHHLSTTWPVYNPQNCTRQRYVKDIRMVVGGREDSENDVKHIRISSGREDLEDDGGRTL